MMIPPPFDVFRIERGGSVRWLEAAAALEDAKTRIEDHGSFWPATYVVVDQRTGSKFLIEAALKSRSYAA